MLKLNTFKLDIITNSNESLLSLSINNQKYSISEELINLNIRISNRDLRRTLEVYFFNSNLFFLLSFNINNKQGFTNKII